MSLGSIAAVNMSLEDIIPEVQQTIIDSIDDSERQDILSLRLVSRRLNEEVEKRFLDAFFKHRRHLLTVQSLSVLQHISSEKRWYGALQSIEFVMNPVRNDENTSMAFLILIFDNLRRAGKTPIISVSTEVHKPFTAFGLLRLYRDMDRLGSNLHRDYYDVHNPPNLSERDITSMLLEAISQARFPVKDLTLSTTRARSHNESFNVAAIAWLDAHGSFCHLRRLSVAFNQRTGYPYGFGEYLRMAKGLEILALDLDDPDMPLRDINDFVHREILFGLEEIRLTTLCLIRGDWDLGVLGHLLRQQRSSLRRLSLDGLYCSSPQGWNTLLSWIIADIQLEAVHIVHMHLDI